MIEALIFIRSRFNSKNVIFEVLLIPTSQRMIQMYKVEY